MAVRSYQPVRLYHAVCDECHAAGPDRESEHEAIEAMTADVASARAGFRIDGCWIRRGNSLLCSRCAERKGE